MVKKLVACIMLLSIVLVVSYAQTDRKGLIEEVLELSGAKGQIAQLPAYVQAQVTPQQRRLSPEAYSLISKTMKEAYTFDALYQEVLDTFEDSFDRDRLTSVAQWFRTPLARKISQLEVEASSPAAIQGMQNFAAQIQSNPPAQERIALMQRLDAASSATESSVAMNVASFRGLALAIDAILPAEKKLKEGQLEQLCNNVRAQIQQPFQNSTLVSLLYTYRSVSGEELMQYIAFWESSGGKWFSSVFNKAIRDAMGSIAEKIGSRVAEAFKE